MNNDKVNVLHELAMARHWLYMINKSEAKNPQRYKDYALRIAHHVNTARTEVYSNQRPSIFSSIMRFTMSYFGWLDRIPYLKREGK